MSDELQNMTTGKRMLQEVRKNMAEENFCRGIMADKYDRDLNFARQNNKSD